MKSTKFFRFDKKTLVLTIIIFVLLGLIFGFPKGINVVCETCLDVDVHCSCPLLGEFIFFGINLFWYDSTTELGLFKIAFTLVQLIISYLIACILMYLYWRILKVKKMKKKLGENYRI